MAVKAKRSRVGRRCLLTPELQRKICQAIEVGALYKSACQANGIAIETFMDWMQRGRGEGKRRKAPMFVAFAQAVEEAQGKSRVLVEAAVRKQHGPWYLTHHPEFKKDWGEEREGGTQVSVVVELADTAAQRIVTLESPALLPAVNGKVQTGD